MKKIKFIKRKNRHLQNIDFKHDYQIIVMGASAGGMEVFSQIFSNLKSDFQIPVFVVQHVHSSQTEYYVQRFNKLTSLTVREAEDKEIIRHRHVYFAPPNYHMLLNDKNTISLSIDARIRFSRPSIDVFFQSAAEIYQEETVGVLFTGANEDGAEGMCDIHRHHGLTIVQDPKTAKHPVMPQSALNLCHMDYVLSIEDIIALLNKIPFRNEL